MDDALRALTRGMVLGGGTTAERVAEVERELGVRFPAEYVAFLVETNGASGPVGDEGWASFDSVEEMVDVNRSYSEDGLDQFEGLVAFGSDGGGEAFCFDRDGTVIVAGYISDREDNVTIGPFRDFMRQLGAGQLLGEDTLPPAGPDTRVEPAPNDRSAELTELTSGFRLRSGAAPAAIAQLEAKFEFRFPPDYAHFLRTSDGAEGMVGDWRIVLYSTEDLLEKNREWIEQGHKPYFVIFGDDGASTAFVFSTRQMAPWITQMPFASAGPDDHVQRGTSLVEFLAALRDHPPAASGA